MAEKNIVITISAKDLSAGELEKARRSLAGFGDEARKIRPSSDAAVGGMSGLMGAARQLLPALSVAGLVGFGKALLDDADALVKLSDKTGIAIEPLQRLKYAAEQSGNTFEQITSAVSMMQKRLSGGDDSALGALKQLGISFADFRAMTPDQQFTAVATEVAKIQDPMERVRVATDLFGKSGAEVLPTLIADVKKLGDEAPKMSEKATRAFETLGDAISGMWSKAKIAVGEGLAAMGDGYSRLAGIVSNLGPTGTFKGLTDAMFDLETEIPKLTGAVPKLDVATAGVALSMEDAEKAGKDLNETLKAQEEQAEKSQAAYKKYADAFTAGIQQQITWQDAFAEQTKQVNQVLVTEGKASLEAWGRALDDNVTAKLKAAAPQIDTLLDAIRKPITGLPTGMPNVVSFNGVGFATMREEIKKTSFSWAGMGEVASSVLNGINNQVAQTASILINTLQGAIKSFASGNVWAGVAAIGTGVVGLIGQAYNKLAKTEGKKVNDLRDAYFSAAGGFEKLHQKLIDAGNEAAFTKLWSAGKVKDWEAAVAAADTALGKLTATQGELAGLQAQLAGRQTMDWKEAEGLAEKYGFSLAGLGQQFESAKLHGSFAELWNDWETMADMGGDVGGMLAGMKDEIAALVKESARLGTEIPAQFKPLIEELLRTSQLFDENGLAITDISTLKFGAPLVSEVDKIITKIDELIAALTNKLVPAFNAVPRSLDIGVGYHYNPTDTGGGGGGGQSDTSGLAAGGVVTSPRRAWIGEGGQPEIVGPISFMTQALAGAMRRVSSGSSSSGRGGENHIHVHVDGREVARAVVPWIPAEVNAYGLG